MGGICQGQELPGSELHCREIQQYKNSSLLSGLTDAQESDQTGCNNKFDQTDKI